MDIRVVIMLLVILLIIGAATVVVKLRIAKERRLKNLERGIKMVPMLFIYHQRQTILKLAVAMKGMLPMRRCLRHRLCIPSSHLHLRRVGRVRSMGRNIYLLRLLRRVVR